MEDYPEKFWHCFVKLVDSKDYAVVNDISFGDLQRQVIEPWLQGRPFTIDGVIVRSDSQVKQIQVVHTPQSQEAYARKHNAAMRASGIVDCATDRQLLPFDEGTDYTFKLLFSGKPSVAPDADTALVARICKRIGHAARILSNRQRKDKDPYLIEDEYDVQDLLHAVLRAYLKYSVQEDPLSKVAGTRAARADISIEDLGVLIEVKYVHRPNDQKRIFNDFSQDLVLYASWPPIKTLLFVIYGASDLRDPEALEKLSGVKEISGKRFDAQIILV